MRKTYSFAKASLTEGGGCECSEQTEGVLLHDFRQLLIHFLRAALGFFDLYELAVHDAVPSE